MDWDYLKMLGVVGVITLGIQLTVLVKDNWFNRTWRGFAAPITFGQVLIEWAVYMLAFIVLSTLMRGVLYLACSYC